MTPSSPGLPLGFHEWMPGLQGMTLALLTFVQEDVPTFSAALLSAGGHLSWQTGFLGCFLGIWMGDLLLYLVARGVGPSLLQRAWVSRWCDPDLVARSERWLDEKGTWVLLTSRFVPGTRLATYVAAGCLRFPLARFALVTGGAVLAWTGGIFLVATRLDPTWLQRLQHGAGGAWRLILAGLILAALVAWGPRHLPRGSGVRLRAWCLRWTRWEFWPAWLFYFPVAFWYLLLACRYRSLTLPAAANPGIFTGGLVGESKLAMLEALHRTSPERTAKACRIEGATLEERMACLATLRLHHGLTYPFILKPDVGQRGMGVKLIRDETQARDCLRQARGAWMVQRYAPGPCEFGVFYARFPREPQGRIVAITEKVFPFVTGDGSRTVEALVWADDRARLMAPTYLKRLGHRRSEVLPEGATLKLVEAGNHAQGCIFRDGTCHRTPALEACIDRVSRRLDGFFVGRYDLRCASVEDLRNGGPFQIIELNGAASEVTNLYDARHSLWTAYGMLFRQWHLVFAIGAGNRSLGTSPTSLKDLLRA